jgi:hypothetical protein
MTVNILTDKERKIIRKLRELAEQAKSEPGGGKFAKDVNTLADRLEAQIKSTPSGRTLGLKYDTNLSATLRALEIWVDNPTKYSYTADLQASEGVGKPGQNSFKCNYFVGAVFTGSRAARGYSVGGSEPFTYPMYGNPLNRYPVSANDIYSGKVTNMFSIDSRYAKIGDIVSFPQADETNSRSSAHVGIYLGDGLYISAHRTNSRFGNQVSDGVEISRVDWGKNPRFKRFEGDKQKYGLLSSTSEVDK